jgi:MFS family permease
MVGGTVADMFRATERGIPMNIFSLVNFVGQASGGLIMGWVGQRGGIRWCYIVRIGCFASKSQPQRSADAL